MKHIVSTWIRVIGVSIAIIVAGLTVLLSPLALGKIGKLLHLDWSQLSNIGQSYGAASALLAALALCVLAASALLQVSQTRVTQIQAARTLQLELLRVAIAEPEYRAAFGSDYTSLDEKTWRLHAYLNLWLMYWQMAYLTGALDTQGVVRLLSAELFAGEAGITYWPLARPAFVAEAKTFSSKRFLALVDKAYAIAKEKQDHRDNRVGIIISSQPGANEASENLLLFSGISILVLAFVARWVGNKRH